MQMLSESPRNTRMVERLVESVDRLLGTGCGGTFAVGWDFREGTITVVSEESMIDDRKIKDFSPAFNFTQMLRPKIISAINENNKLAFAHNFFGRCEVRWTVSDEPEVKRFLKRTQT